MSVALAGAECPKCHKRNGSVIARVYLASAIIGLVIGALLGIVLLAATKGADYGYYLGIATAVVTSFIYALVRGQRLLTGAILHPDRPL